MIYLPYLTLVPGTGRSIVKRQPLTLISVKAILKKKKKIKPFLVSPLLSLLSSSHLALLLICLIIVLVCYTSEAKQNNDSKLSCISSGGILNR